MESLEPSLNGALGNKERIMKKLPEGYKIVNYHDGSEMLRGPGERELMSWRMDGSPEGYYVTASTCSVSKEEMKEILAAMTAYLEGAK